MLQTSSNQDQSQNSNDDITASLLNEADSNEDRKREIELNRRSLIVSAVLRCFYASITSTPNEKHKQSTLDQLK